MPERVQAAVRASDMHRVLVILRVDRHGGGVGYTYAAAGFPGLSADEGLMQNRASGLAELVEPASVRADEHRPVGHGRAGEVPVTRRVMPLPDQKPARGRA